MKPKNKISSKKKGETKQQENAMSSMVKALIEIFVRSDENYGAITNMKADINSVHRLLMDYVNREKLDVYMLKLEDRILLSKTNMCFEKLYKTIRRQSNLEVKKDVMEIWDNAYDKILHLFVIPTRKHFIMKYSTIAQKKILINQILSTT